jgi:hypothetical protein
MGHIIDRHFAKNSRRYILATESEVSAAAAIKVVVILSIIEKPELGYTKALNG